jgi:hypothetical protein
VARELAKVAGEEFFFGWGERYVMFPEKFGETIKAGTTRCRQKPGARLS